jgi:cell division protein FtsB
MKANEKTGKALVPIAVFSIFLFLVAYVAMKINIERLQTDLIKQTEVLKKLHEDTRDYAAKMQPLEEERRIDSLARNHLQLVKDQGQVARLVVSRSKIDALSAPAGEAR